MATRRVAGLLTAGQEEVVSGTPSERGHQAACSPAAAYARGEHRAWDGPEFETWIGDLMKRLVKEYS